MDLSSEDDKPRNLGLVPFQVPIRILFSFSFVAFFEKTIYQPYPHPLSSPTRGHDAADNQQGIHRGYTKTKCKNLPIDPSHCPNSNVYTQ